MRVLWRWTVLQWALAVFASAPRAGCDVTRLVAPDGAKAVLLCVASRNVAREAATLLNGGLSFSAAHSAHLLEFCAELETLRNYGIPFTATAVVASCAALHAPTNFPFCGRLRPLEPAAVEALAGESKTPPIILPAQLSLVGDCVHNFNDVSNALRHTSQLCELLANQMEYLPNTYYTRLCLIQQLITSVIPLPLPFSHVHDRRQCFWMREPIRYETQADLLRLLNMVGRHFAACCFSVRATRAFDAVRLVVVACIATLADVLMRLRAVDVPSLFCLNYSGEAEGPGAPFGFEMGSFAVESEDLQLSSPELHIARSRVLDYFTAQRAIVSEACILFRFERTMAFGNAEFQLLRQLCLHSAFPSEPAAVLLPSYLSGESRLLLENFPELGFFRDIVYLFKMLMVPSSEALPDLCAWMPLDAMLNWRHRPDEGFIVSGFGRQLNASVMTRQAEGGDGSWVSRGLRRILGLAEKPRAPPSAADPSALLQFELGSGELRVKREEDVLHLKQLPSFDGALNDSEAELFMQYLTVPYLRVPLLMHFFAQPSHVHALGHPRLQAALDAAMFEPGLWQHTRFKTLPESVPAPEREHLATPSGILFNELVRSPAGLTVPLLRLIELALELDSGRYSPDSPNCAAILYVIRTAVRIEGFVRAVLKANRAPAEVQGVGGASIESVRGLTCGEAVRAELAKCAARLRSALVGGLHAMLEQWSVHELRERNLHAACVIFAHLGFSYKFVEEADLDTQAVSTLLCAQVFLGNNNSFGMDIASLDMRFATMRLQEGGGGGGESCDVASDAILGVLQIELFELFARHRCKLLRWLEAKPRAQCNAIMEAIVRTVTCNGPRQVLPGAARQVLQPRNWWQSAGFRGSGRYLPDTASLAFAATFDRKGGKGDAGGRSLRGGQLALTSPVDTAATAPEAAREGKQPEPGQQGSGERAATLVRDSPHDQQLESWLQRVTSANDAKAEVNVQLGLFSLRKRMLSPLPTTVCEAPDFIAAYGSTLDPIQAIEVASTKQRRCFHLVGARADVQLWAPGAASASAMPPCCTHGQDEGNGRIGRPPLRRFPLDLCAGERWVQEVLLAEAAAEVRGWSLRLVKDDVSGARSATLQATHTLPTGSTTIKEVMLLRAPPVVFIFELVEYGRRWFRSLVFVSDDSFCLHRLMPRRLRAMTRRGSHGRTPYQAGDASHVTPPLPSVIVSRTLTANLGPQTFMPPRLLRGLLPAVLLQQYDLWQNADDSLSGYAKQGHELDPAFAHTQLHIRLADNGVDASATVERLSLVTHEESPNASEAEEGGSGGASRQFSKLLCAHCHAAAIVDKSKRSLTLLNLLSAPVGGALFCLTEQLLLLEDLTHILAWSQEASPGFGAVEVTASVACVDLIELPRLQLSFQPRQKPQFAADAVSSACSAAAPPIQLHCLQHEGYYLVCSGLAVSALTNGLPNALLLEHKDGRKAILVSACARPSRPATDDVNVACDNSACSVSMAERLFPTELELDRANPTWLANLGPTKHYIYPMHLTDGRLHCPTLAAVLYMLLLRFLSRQYDAVVALASQCTSKTELSAEEAQICAVISDVDDTHPDAHACRLWLSLYTLHTPIAALLRWNLRGEVTAYARKHAHVSMQLRLDPANELVLLEFVLAQPPVQSALATVELGDDALHTRHAMLVAVAAAAAAAPSPGLLPNMLEVALPPIRRPEPAPQFDTICDTSCIENEGVATALLHKFSTLTYSRPESMVGLRALKALDKWISHGLELRGGWDEKGFLFLYELMRGDLLFKILTNDSSHTLGSMLLRMLPPSDTQSKDMLMCSLRVIANNPHITRNLPKCGRQA